MYIFGLSFVLFIQNIFSVKNISWWGGDLGKKIRNTLRNSNNFLSNSRRKPKSGVTDRKKNMYLVTLLYEFREMALTYFDSCINVR